jgi:hypothetical protein
MKNIRQMRVSLLLLLIITSCQKKEKFINDFKDETLQNKWGNFKGKLYPVNPSQTPSLRGSLTAIYRQEFTATLRLAGARPSSLSLQGIHIGRCPDSRDDQNHDGLIDGEEGFKAFKEMIIPLDDDLNSQHMGWGIFPVTDSFGGYIWSRVATLENLLEDLRMEDINPYDEMSKILDRSLSLEGKVVVIRGINNLISLPDSVAGMGRLSPHAAFPVACGKLEKIFSTPGKIEKDEEISILYDSNQEGHGFDDDAFFSSLENDEINYGD